MVFFSSLNQCYNIFICVYWFELFSQVSDVAHRPPVFLNMSAPCPRVQKRRRRNIAFSLYELYGNVLAQEALPLVPWNLKCKENFPWKSLLSLPDLCLGVEKTIFKEMMHFYYMTCMVMPLNKNFCLGGNEIQNVGRPFLSHHYYMNILCLCKPCLRVERFFF